MLTGCWSEHTKTETQIGRLGDGGVGGNTGMEGDLKVKHRHAHTCTQTHPNVQSLSGGVSVEHQSLLDMVGEHTGKRFML